MDMVWMFSGIVFIAQIITCMIFRDKLKRYLPTIIALFFISTTVLRANMGDLDPQRIVNQMLVCVAGIAAAVLYHGVMAVWGILMRRRDPAQKLRK